MMQNEEKDVNRPTDDPNLSELQTTASKPKARFQIVLARHVADAELELPETLSPTHLVDYIKNHLDDAVVLNTYTEEQPFIHKESIKLI